MDRNSLDIAKVKLEQLKSIFPEVFSEGKIDFERLKRIVGESVDGSKQHFELTWAGKTEAQKEVQIPTSATLYADKGNSINLKEAKNVFIEGENLEVLKILQKSYFCKIKMIYIDPPYNTGNDSFVYPDNYAEKQSAYKKRSGIANEQGYLNKQDFWRKNIKENGQFHSVWLSMMYPRLYLSRNLLTDDGVIFISIDDNEVTNLKMICDEIFGEENFVSKIIWEKKYSPANDAKYLSATHEYVLLYAKNKAVWRPILEQRTDAMNARYENFDNDPRGAWKPGGFSVKTYSANYDYPIETPSGVIAYPPKGGCWQTSKSKYLELLADNRIYFGKNGDAKPQLKQFLTEVKQGLVTKSLWLHTEVGNTQLSMQEIEKIFGDKFFDTPKPTKLIKKMINIAVKKDDHSIILDFFAGSGTTAQAVLEQNEADGGNRQFICVQLPEPIDTNSNAHKAGYFTIADLTKARIINCIQQLLAARVGEIADNSKAALGFASYKNGITNFKIWESNLSGKADIKAQLLNFTRQEINGASEENMLVELMLKAGLELSTHYDKVGSFYKIEDLWICFERYDISMKAVLINNLAKSVIFLNSSFIDDWALSDLKITLTNHNIALQII